MRKRVRSTPATVFALSGPKMFIIPNTRRIIKVTLVKPQNVSYCSEKKNFRNDLKSTVHSKNISAYIMAAPSTSNYKSESLCSILL